MNKRAGFDEDTKLAIYKETNKNEIEKITKLDDPICEVWILFLYFFLKIIHSNKYVFFTWR